MQGTDRSQASDSLQKQPTYGASSVFRLTLVDPTAASFTHLPTTPINLTSASIIELSLDLGRVCGHVALSNVNISPDGIGYSMNAFPRAVFS